MKENPEVADETDPRSKRNLFRRLGRLLRQLVSSIHCSLLFVNLLQERLVIQVYFRKQEVYSSPAVQHGADFSLCLELQNFGAAVLHQTA